MKKLAKKLVHETICLLFEVKDFIAPINDYDEEEPYVPVLSPVIYNLMDLESALIQPISPNK